MSYSTIDFIMSKIPAKELHIRVSMYAKIAPEFEPVGYRDDFKKQMIVLDIITILSEHLKTLSPARYRLYWWEHCFRAYMMQFHHHLETFHDPNVVKEIIEHFTEMILRVEKDVLDSTGKTIHLPPENLTVEEQLARYKQAKNRK